MSKQCISCFNEYQEGIRECPYCGYIEGSHEQEGCHLPLRTVLHQRYRIGKSLGNGNFGVTYIAWDTMLEMRVAIKEYLPRELATRVPGNSNILVNTRKEVIFENGKESFLRESRLLAELRDAETEYDEAERTVNSGALGIVKIFNYFEENNTAYIVMEYLDGMTLSDYVQERGRLTYNEALNIVIPMLRTLDVVHSHGIIHRDIAPDNVFICRDGRVVLIDFGAARYMTTGSSSSLATIVKMGYAPQEQYKTSGERGSWSDIYAVAATLYFMLTNETPQPSFDRLDKDELLPPSQVIGKKAGRNGVTKNVDNAILNAMNILPQNRTQTANEFIAELTADVDGKKIARVDENIERESPLKAIPKWAKTSIAVLTLALVGLAALFIFVGSRWINTTYVVPDGMARVPNVTENCTVDAAEEKLYYSNLLLVISGYVYDDYLDQGLVLLQNPHAGSVVYNGSAVNVSVSLPQNSNTVPNVLCFTREYAAKLMEEAGFEVIFEEVYSDDVAPGCVVEQSVTGGTQTSVTTTIIIKTSAGPENPDETNIQDAIDIPYCIGKQYEQANRDVRAQGLYVAVSSAEYSDTIPYGEIISQSPEAGSTGETGTTIFVTISLGKKMVTVPLLQYLTEEEAEKALKKQGLEAKMEYSENQNIKKGIVFDQSIPSGTQVELGTTVTLSVSSGYMVEVPDVVNLSQEEACEKLLSANLAYAITTAGSKTVPKGTVISQSEEAGSKLGQGSVVTVVVSAGNTDISVSGLSIAPATLTLDYGQSYTLIASVKPSNATNTAVSWSSSNSGVVSVSSAGVLSANGVGTATVTARSEDGGYTATCAVTVRKQLSRIEVVSKPSQTSYYIGESVSYSGLTIRAKYSDGSVETVTSKCTIGGFDASSSGNKSITCRYTYNGATKECGFYVLVRKLSSIAITNTPSKTAYSINEAFSASGLAVTATYDDGASRDVTGKCSIDSSGFSSAKGGRYSISVRYAEGGVSLSKSFTVQVRSLSDISIKSHPTKTNYKINDTFSASGLVVEAIYDDGSSKEVTSKCNVDSSRFDSSKNGSYEIVVSYNEGEVSVNKRFTVSVSADISISYSGSNPLNHGATGTLTISTNDSNLLNEITWSSDNSGVVSVGGNGATATVTGNGAGTTTIRAKVGEYSVSYSLSSYGAWSDWSTSQPSGENLEIQKKDGYITSTKSTQTSSSNSMPGWTLYQTDDNSYWTGYGSVYYSYSNPGNSASLKSWYDPERVEQGHNKLVGYRYYAYREAGGNGACKHFFNDNGASMWTDSKDSASFVAPNGTRSCGICNKSWNRYIIDGRWYFWYEELNEWVDTSYNRDRWAYQTRDYIESYTYHFYKWSDYTGWTEGSTPANTDNHRYEYQAKYRYRQCP